MWSTHTTRVADGDVLAVAGAAAAIAAVAVLVWTAGQLGGLLWHHHWPASSVRDAFLGLWRFMQHPAAPAAAWPAAARSDIPGPAGYYPVLVALVVLLALPAAGVWAVWRGWRPATMARVSRGGRVAGRRRPGFAGPDVIRRSLSPAAMQRTVAMTRPSLAGTTPAVEEISAYMGEEDGYGRSVRTTFEDSVMIVGLAGCGKSMRLLVQQICEWVGPAVIPSTKDDLLLHTALLRSRAAQPLWVFNPTQIGQWHDTLRWSPVAGCEDPLTATLRATAFVFASSAGKGVRNGDFWRTQAVKVLQALLHAAALGDHDMRTVRRWASQSEYAEAIALLQSSPTASHWRVDLEAVTTYGDDAQGGVIATLIGTLSCLDDPRVLDACCPDPEHPGFDPETFLQQRGRLYLLGSSGAQRSMAPLITALVESIVETAKHRAARVPGRRLDPPLGLFLDEVAQIAPLPSLPSLVADGRGQGIATFVVLQNFAQGRARWGDDDFQALKDACTAKLVFGGLTAKSDLDEVSAWCPEIDEPTRSRTRTPGGRRLSTTISQRRVPCLTPAQVRTIPRERAVLFYREEPPVQLRLRGWWTQRRYSAEVAAAKAAHEARWSEVR